jgi:hypothetical protein
MKQLATLFADRAKAKPKPVSERGELIDYFHANANAERDGKRYKKLPIRYYAVKLSHLKIADLYYLKSVCEDARRRGGSWAKAFWGSLRVKTAPNV